MLNFIIRRLLFAIVTLLFVSAIAFVIIQLPPGDFTDVYRRSLVEQGGLSMERPKSEPR